MKKSINSRLFFLVPLVFAFLLFAGYASAAGVCHGATYDFACGAVNYIINESCTFTDNMNCSYGGGTLSINNSIPNIVVDGAGYNMWYEVGSMIMGISSYYNNNLTIRNLTFINANMAFGAYIDNNLTFEYNTIIDSQYGMQIVITNSSTIQHNYIYKTNASISPGYGIELMGGHNNYIYDNTVSEYNNTAITNDMGIAFVQYTDGITDIPYNNTVYGNDLIHDSDGIALYPAINTTIESNTLIGPEENLTQGIFLNACINTTILHNNISLYDEGISDGYGSFSTIYLNNIFNSSGDYPEGISEYVMNVFNVSNNTITDVTDQFSPGTGIYVDSSNGTIEGNRIIATGTKEYEGALDIEDIFDGDVTIRNNIIYGGNYDDFYSENAEGDVLNLILDNSNISFHYVNVEGVEEDISAYAIPLNYRDIGIFFGGWSTGSGAYIDMLIYYDPAKVNNVSNLNVYATDNGTWYWVNTTVSYPMFNMIEFDTYNFSEFAPLEYNGTTPTPSPSTAGGITCNVLDTMLILLAIAILLVAASLIFAWNNGVAITSKMLISVFVVIIVLICLMGAIAGQVGSVCAP